MSKAFDTLTALVAELNPLLGKNESPYIVRQLKGGGWCACREDNQNTCVDESTLRYCIEAYRAIAADGVVYDAMKERYDSIVAQIKTVVSDDDWKFVCDYLDPDY